MTMIWNTYLKVQIRKSTRSKRTNESYFSEPRDSRQQLLEEYADCTSWKVYRSTG